MLYCISGIVGLQLNILLMCIKSVGRIAYYHRGHIALKHGSDWNIPMPEFHQERICGYQNKESAIPVNMVNQCYKAAGTRCATVGISSNKVQVSYIERPYIRCP